MNDELKYRVKQLGCNSLTETFESQAACLRLKRKGRNIQALRNAELAQDSALVLLKFYWWSVVIQDRGIKCSLSKFSDDTKLSSGVAIPERQDFIQRNLDKVKNWPLGNTCGLRS
ncbi:hypothetical protein HGM15179_005248 [Zosterops borbonicus]|uniref:Rna-directed dna polymerase from mobile element jockey-like n=1 Tax=Zosterops borbonicus TaxID=364589 RepID=A0A8K1LPS7_9PASS|nr:hypothetical protein HGM15179_005248 [Zosterops borbonicus]